MKKIRKIELRVDTSQGGGAYEEVRNFDIVVSNQVEIACALNQIIDRINLDLRPTYLLKKTETSKLKNKKVRS